MKKKIAMLIASVWMPLMVAQADLYPNEEKNYTPTKEDQRLGLLILNETNSEIKTKGSVNYAHYWNLATAYRYLGAEKDTIYNYLKKSMETDPFSFLEIVNSNINIKDNDITKTGFYQSLGNQFTNLIATAKKNTELNSKSINKITNIINQEVVDTLISMMDKDNLYRKNPFFFKDKSLQKKQYILDSLNTEKLYVIYKKYGYPGKSITGDNEYKNYFCFLVEHGQNQSNAQRFWLPIIAAAFKKGELSPGPLKMLLDRIHWLESNKQYFGSHLGIALDSDENITKIRSQYGL